MRLNEIIYTGALPIDGYGPGFFRIGGQVHHGAALILPDGVRDWAGLEQGAALVELAGQIDVLFFGMGPEIAPLPAAVRGTLENAGLGVEVMNTPAACRTYNVLLSEGRRIGAAVLPV